MIWHIWRLQIYHNVFIHHGWDYLILFIIRAWILIFAQWGRSSYSQTLIMGKIDRIICIKRGGQISSRGIFVFSCLTFDKTGIICILYNFITWLLLSIAWQLVPVQKCEMFITLSITGVTRPVTWSCQRETPFVFCEISKCSIVSIFIENPCLADTYTLPPKSFGLVMMLIKPAFSACLPLVERTYSIFWMFFDNKFFQTGVYQNYKA